MCAAYAPSPSCASDDADAPSVQALRDIFFRGLPPKTPPNQRRHVKPVGPKLLDREARKPRPKLTPVPGRPLWDNTQTPQGPQANAPRLNLLRSTAMQPIKRQAAVRAHRVQNPFHKFAGVGDPLRGCLIKNRHPMCTTQTLLDYHGYIRTLGDGIIMRSADDDDDDDAPTPIPPRRRQPGRLPPLAPKHGATAPVPASVVQSPMSGPPPTVHASSGAVSPSYGSYSDGSEGDDSDDAAVPAAVPVPELPGATEGASNDAGDGDVNSSDAGDGGGAGGGTADGEEGAGGPQAATGEECGDRDARDARVGLQAVTVAEGGGGAGSGDDGSAQVNHGSADATAHANDGGGASPDAVLGAEVPTCPEGADADADVDASLPAAHGCEENSDLPEAMPTPSSSEGKAPAAAPNATGPDTAAAPDPGTSAGGDAAPSGPP